MQIYNEKIFDLMQDRRRAHPLQLRDNHKDALGGNEDNVAGNAGTAVGSGSVHVRGMSVYRIYSKDEAITLLKQGMRNRAIRATDFNSESSRSHTILQLFVTVEDCDDQGLMVLKRSTFSLVDLAGSEKWRGSLNASSSGANLQVEAQTQAQVKEMTHINTSLHVLGNCVSALIEPNRKHIPFRDSVLTRLLQDPLGGNGRTILIATIHADAAHRDETYSTLQFASRAMRIKVALTANVGINEQANLAEAQRQIKVLRAKLQELQQGGLTSRSTDGNHADGESAVMSGAGGAGTCAMCAQNEKLINALRAKVIELHKENQLLRNGGAGTGSMHDSPHFRTPKPLPLSSALAKLSVNHSGDAGQGGSIGVGASWEGQTAEWLNSSLSSMDSHTSPAVVRKKKKTTKTGTGAGTATGTGTGKAVKSAGTAGKSGSRPATPSGSVNDQALSAASQQPVTNTSSANDLLMQSILNKHNSAQQQHAGSTSHAVSANPTGHLPNGVDSVAGPTLSGSPNPRPRSSDRTKTSGVSAAERSTHIIAPLETPTKFDYTANDYNLKLSDSSLEKVMKAANMVLGAPPSDSLAILQLMSSDSSFAQQKPDSPGKHASSGVKKKKPKASKVSTASATVTGSPERTQQEPQSSPSPPNTYSHPARSDMVQAGVGGHSSAATHSKVITAQPEARKKSEVNPYLQPPFQLPADGSAKQRGAHASAPTATTSAIAPLSTGAGLTPPRKPQLVNSSVNSSIDFLEHSQFDGIKSPPLRRSVENTDTSKLRIATGGVGVAGASTGTSALSVSRPGSQPRPSSQPPLQPLPALSTPMRRPLPNANPDACAKHGLEQCVLCRMFGDTPTAGTTSYATGGAATDYSAEYSGSAYDYGSSAVDTTGGYGANYTPSYALAPLDAPPGQLQPQQQPQQQRGEGERAKPKKTRAQAPPPQQSSSQYDYNAADDMSAYSTPSTYTPAPMSVSRPPTLQVPPQPSSWQQRSSDFSPSGIYGHTLEMVGHKQGGDSYGYTGAGVSSNVNSDAEYFSGTTYTEDAGRDEPCKFHGVTECLLCQMRGADVKKAQAAQQQQQQQQHMSAPMLHSPAPMQYGGAPSQQHQTPNHGNYGYEAGAPSPYRHEASAPSPYRHEVSAPSPYRHEVSAASPYRHEASAPSPYRHNPQNYISAQDSGEGSLYGHGSSGSSPPRSSRTVPLHRGTGTAGAAYSAGGAYAAQNGSYSAPHTQAGAVSQAPPLYPGQAYGAPPSQSPYPQQQPYQQQMPGPQVRNIKSIPQQRQTYQPEPDDAHMYSQPSPYGKAPPAQMQASPLPERSVYGNSVQTVQALRQGNAPNHGYEQQMMFPRSSSSPLPAGQQSILPPIMNEYEFHPHVSAIESDRQYSEAGRGQQPSAAQPPPQQYNHDDQLYYQQEYALASGAAPAPAAGSKITYLEDTGDEGESSGEEEGPYGAGAAGARPGSREVSNVGRAVIKKKKKVKKKVSKKVPAGGPSSAAVALAAPQVTGGPYGAPVKRRL
jgi:hypothetical protein